ncbi:hypothetical protein [Chelativorans salis]|uniref:Sulfotransferase domain-containing protein n=1 Tax=Chelativorans salis TaxID=2978478 RepID=A0ABT2LVS6_9HYPH|nr:hypothetical protein [Chelativorans sp. EGI FJ00035]MCT7378209.1 hypothetical protein [Chelativorans sp. EGI FJ00035]
MKTVIHIGPMKTGTTYIQNILQKSRSELLKLGWVYPGRLLNQQHACYGICGDEIPWVTNALSRKNERLGEELIRQLQTRETNVIISSEALASLTPIGVENFLEAIGGADEVIATIRPLEKLLPSAWQQLIKGGSTKSLDEFFEHMAINRNSKSGLWRTYAYGEAVKIWSHFLPVSVIRLSQTKDRDSAWDLFRQAANLPEIPPTHIKAKESNISLNLEAAEILRHVNITLKKEGIDKDKVEEFSRFFLKKIIHPLSDISRGTRITCRKSDMARIELWDSEEMSLVQEHASKMLGDKFGVEYSIKKESKLNESKVLEEMSLHLIQLWGKTEAERLKR